MCFNSHIFKIQIFKYLNIEYYACPCILRLRALTGGWRATRVAVRRTLTLGAPAGVGLSTILLRPQRRGPLLRFCGVRRARALRREGLGLLFGLAEGIILFN